MAIHGCRGQIICGNSLFLDKDWRFGYEINPYQQWMPVPHLLPLEKENCMQLAYSEDMLKSRQISVIDAKQGDKVVGQQLTIF